MSTSSSPTVARRRRGPELESALLAAAWEELVEVGFARMTMESVAARAQTGVAVLYRRWPNKDELALAAIEHERGAHPVPLPDTGTLRGDLLEMLTGMGETRASYFAIAFSAAYSGLLAGTGLTPAEFRSRILGDQRRARVAAIYQRAHDRGEIDQERLPEAVLALPFDLVRHDLLMDLKPVKPARIRSIVDDVVLPLMRSGDRGRIGDG